MTEPRVARSILHADMDAFFASVEIRKRPELAGRPVIVGGSGNRAVVTSATYEARAFGVRSAMPVLRARRLCPDAILVAPDMAAYRDASADVMEIFRSITPLVEPISLDEAFLDVSGVRRTLGGPEQVAELLRARMSDELSLTCSVGVGPSKFVAKLASTRCKPDGVLVVPPSRVIAFLHPLPVGALWGVGEATAETLSKLGLHTVGDLAATPTATLVRALGQAAGMHLSALARGKDDRAVVPHEPEKSIGAEHTFDTDIDDPADVRRELLRLAERVAARLRAAGVRSRTLSIKIRYADFRTVTRARTLAEATDVGRDVYATASDLYDALGLVRPRIRLVGVRAEGLISAEDHSHQLAFGERKRGWREAEFAMDRATRRFGSDAVRPASLVARGGARVAADPLPADG
ncbi:MAG: polymerase [Frankiaceae bacterium]|nr:polymerase [Frankiaceae bacterium]